MPEEGAGGRRARCRWSTAARPPADGHRGSSTAGSCRYAPSRRGRWASPSLRRRAPHALAPAAAAAECRRIDRGKLQRSCRALSLPRRSEEQTSELQSLMRISYAVFCLKKKKKHDTTTNIKSK